MRLGWSEHQPRLNLAECLLDAQRAAFEVDIAPAQAAELTEAQARVNRRGKQRPELLITAGRLEEPCGLGGVQGVHLATRHPWRANGLGGVDGEHLPPDSLLECFTGDSLRCSPERADPRNPHRPADA